MIKAKEEREKKSRKIYLIPYYQKVRFALLLLYTIQYKSLYFYSGHDMTYNKNTYNIIAAKISLFPFCYGSISY